MLQTDQRTECEFFQVNPTLQQSNDAVVRSDAVQGLLLSKSPLSLLKIEIRPPSNGLSGYEAGKPTHTRLRRMHRALVYDAVGPCADLLHRFIPVGRFGG